MAEGGDTLTFPMSRDSESGSRLKAIISNIVPRFSDNDSDDVLSEYITVLICNGKSQRQAIEDLEAFLGEQTYEFIACLWALLVKHFCHGKPASEPRTAIDFRSHRATDDTNSMNENLISVTAPIIEGVEVPVSPKDNNMKMLRQELISSPCRRVQRVEKNDFNYSKKILRSVIVTANKQPCGTNPNKYEKSMDERSRVVKKLPYLPGREMGSQSVPSGAVSSFYGGSAHQDNTSHVSVWDRLGRPTSKFVWDRVTSSLPKFGIQAHEYKVLQQHGPSFPATYSEQYNMTFQREVPGVDCWRRAIQPMSETITPTEPHAAYNLSRKRRYGTINSNSKEFSSVMQYKKAKQDVEKPALLSYQSPKSDLFSEIKNVKEKLQELELRISQSKQLKKQKIEELKISPQSGEMQNNQDAAESSIIHVTNVHYAAKKEAISMLFSKCGAVKNVTVVTDPVTNHRKGRNRPFYSSAFVTFATKESVNKAISLSGTMFYSRPIKVSKHVIASRVMSADSAPKAVDSAPKAIDSAPKAVDSAPKATDSAPKAADSAPKAADSAPKAIDSALKALDSAPKAKDSTPEVVPGGLNMQSC